MAADDTEPPLAPNAVSFVDRTGTSVTVQWGGYADPTIPEDNVGVEDYLISNGETTLVVPESGRVVFTGLTPETSYTFTARARDAAGNVSQPSPSRTISTGVDPDTEPPTPVTRIQFEPVADGAHYVWWSGATDNVNLQQGLRYRVTTDGGTDHTVSKTFYGDHPNVGDPLLTGCTITVRVIDSSGNVSEPRSTDFC